MSDEAAKIKHREYQKRYYKKHKKEIAERRKGKVNRELKRAIDNNYYARYKEERRAKMMARYWRQKALVDAVALHYGCQNKNCKWSGKFRACQLDFHHFKRDEKTKEVGQLYNRKLSIIAAEINKCVVLCRCCHSLLHSSEDVAISEDMMCRVNNSLELVHRA